jgi:hypothetical protein
MNLANKNSDFERILETYKNILESLFGGATELGKALAGTVDGALSNYTSSLIGTGHTFLYYLLKYILLYKET